jgi:hypothetical protein
MIRYIIISQSIVHNKLRKQKLLALVVAISIVGDYVTAIAMHIPNSTPYRILSAVSFMMSKYLCLCKVAYSMLHFQSVHIYIFINIGDYHSGMVGCGCNKGTDVM